MTEATLFIFPKQTTSDDSSPGSAAGVLASVTTATGSGVSDVGDVTCDVSRRNKEEL